MKEGDSITVKEIARLADWLKSNGHTAEEIVECIQYIAQKQK